MLAELGALAENIMLELTWCQLIQLCDALQLQLWVVIKGAKSRVFEQNENRKDLQVGLPAKLEL